VGATSWYHCVAEDSRIPKMPVINPFQALVYPQSQQNYPAWIVNPQPQLLGICLFSVKRSADLELWISISQAIDELVSSKNLNFLF
jgi:hypothetical protein